MTAKNGKAKLVAVIGDPITHSLSPAIHEYWLQHYDINGAYIPLQVSSSHFEQAIKLYTETGFIGFNVTLPHKESAFKLVQSYDDVSAVCQATNTIKVQKNGSLHGMNTDAYGFTKLIEEERANAPFSLENVLLFGAGGSARAVIYVLAQAGCRSITIVNRTSARAEALIHMMSAYAPDLKFRHIVLDSFSQIPSETQCVINTLSTGQSIPLSWEPLIEIYSQKCVYIDISYGRYGTEMTRSALKLKRRQTDGLCMLLHQAVPGFEQWFGVTPHVDEKLMKHVRTIAASNR